MPSNDKDDNYILEGIISTHYHCFLQLKRRFLEQNNTDQVRHLLTF